MKVPFFSLQEQYQTLRERFLSGIDELCGQSQFILGPQVHAFEEAFASYLGASACVGVANGTDALHLAFRAIDLEPGDEVLVPANTFIATPLGVLFAGGVPVPVDIDEKSYLIDLKDAERRLSPRTRAICPVHLFGRAVDMTALQRFALEHKLKIVEDVAQAQGACWEGRKAGTFGAANCFSFYPGKNLGAYGDAGAIVTNDAELAAHFRALRNYGSEVKYHHPIVGMNSRLDTLQAFVLSLKLPMLDAWNERRREIAKRYSRNLGDVERSGKIILPEMPNDLREHVFHQFVVRMATRRERVMQRLADAGVHILIHYPVPFHRQKAFSGIDLKNAPLSVTDTLSEQIMSLPIYPELTDEQVDFVSDRLCEFVRDL